MNGFGKFTGFGTTNKKELESPDFSPLNILKAFGNGGNIQQIIGFQHNKTGHNFAVFVSVGLQQLELLSGLG